LFVKLTPIQALLWILYLCWRKQVLWRRCWEHSVIIKSLNLGWLQDKFLLYDFLKISTTSPIISANSTTVYRLGILHFFWKKLLDFLKFWHFAFYINYVWRRPALRAYIIRHAKQVMVYQFATINELETNLSILIS